MSTPHENPRHVTLATVERYLDAANVTPAERRQAIAAFNNAGDERAKEVAFRSIRSRYRGKSEGEQHKSMT